MVSMEQPKQYYADDLKVGDTIAYEGDGIRMDKDFSSRVSWWAHNSHPIHHSSDHGRALFSRILPGEVIIAGPHTSHAICNMTEQATGYTWTPLGEPSKNNTAAVLAGDVLKPNAIEVTGKEIDPNNEGFSLVTLKITAGVASRDAKVPSTDQDRNPKTANAPEKCMIIERVYRVPNTEKVAKEAGFLLSDEEYRSTMDTMEREFGAATEIGHLHLPTQEEINARKIAANYADDLEPGKPLEHPRSTTFDARNTSIAHEVDYALGGRNPRYLRDGIIPQGSASEVVFGITVPEFSEGADSNKGQKNTRFFPVHAGDTLTANSKVISKEPDKDGKGRPITNTSAIWSKVTGQATGVDGKSRVVETTVRGNPFLTREAAMAALSTLEAAKRGEVQAGMTTHVAGQPAQEKEKA